MCDAWHHLIFDIAAAEKSGRLTSRLAARSSWEKGRCARRLGSLQRDKIEAGRPLSAVDSISVGRTRRANSRGRELYQGVTWAGGRGADAGTGQWAKQLVGIR